MRRTLPLVAALTTSALFTACERERLAPLEFELEAVAEVDGPQRTHITPIDFVVSKDRLWSVDINEAQVHAFDFDGRHTGTFLRKGQGPAELHQPTAIGLWDGGVWVLNGGNERVDFLDDSGVWVAAQRLPEQALPAFHAVRAGNYFFLARLTGQRPSGDQPIMRTLAEDPRGITGALRVGDDLVYLFTQLTREDGTQPVIVANREGEILGEARNSLGMHISLAAFSGSFMFAAALDNASSELRVVRLASRSN